MLRDDGEAETVKSGAPLTDSDAVVDRVRAPLVPVRVSVDVAIGVVAEVVTVSVDVPDVSDAGEKLAVVFDGTPEAERFTVPEKPFSGVTVTVYVVLLPRTTDAEAGLTDTLKSGEGPLLPTGVFMSAWISLAVSARL
jgi:hypothetical protein